MPRPDILPALEEWRVAMRCLDRVMVLRERAEREIRLPAVVDESRAAQRLERRAPSREEEAQDRYPAACQRVDDAIRRDMAQMGMPIESMSRTAGGEGRAPPRRGGEGEPHARPPGDR